MTDDEKQDHLLRAAARLYLWQQAFGGAVALILMVLALYSLAHRQ